MKHSTVPTFLDQLGTDAEIAARLTPPRGPKAVAQWRTRETIPPRHFPTLVSLAAERGIQVSMEELYALAFASGSRAA